MAQQITTELNKVITSLQNGGFALLHDSGKRENEVDMVVAAQHVTPEHISRMRKDAGGLICLSIENSIAKNIGLDYMHNTLFFSNNFNEKLKKMVYGTAPYGDHPTFSIWINHAQTRTGITDQDRALTINEMASISTMKNIEQQDYFISSFKTPGHVPLLIAEEGLVEKRQGHTEMSILLMQMANLISVSTICEMMDAETHTALSIEKARAYARENNIPFLDANELLDYSKVPKF